MSDVKDFERPTSADIVLVLERLDVAGDLLDAAALHLATSTDVLVGVNAVSDDSNHWWVGNVALGTVRLYGGRAQRIRQAAEWASATSTNLPGGTYLNLCSNASGLVKVSRTGVRNVAFGSELLGTVTVCSEPEVPHDVLAEVAGWAISGTRVHLPGVVTVDGCGYLVERDGQVWTVRSSVSGSPPSVSAGVLHAQLDDCALYIVGELGGTYATKVLGSRVVGTIDAEVSVLVDGTHVVVVPVSVSAGGEIIGCPSQHAGAWETGAAVLPSGYELVGPACFDDGLIVMHTRSKIRGRLAPLSENGG